MQLPGQVTPPCASQRDARNVTRRANCKRSKRAPPFRALPTCGAVLFVADDRLALSSPAIARRLAETAPARRPHCPCARGFHDRRRRA